MNEFLIRPFELCDFINSNWTDWKRRALQEAWENFLERSENLYAGAGNQSKTPLLWDDDDWRYLSQFPPQLWTAALQYRYNEGLIKASKIREREKKLDNVSDQGTVILTGKKGVKYVFENVYTGFRTLIDKLEKPVKYHKEHNPPGSEANAVGIQDIDPFDDKETLDGGTPNPKWRGNYKHGRYDYDLTRPVEIPPDYFDSLPDSEIKTPKGKPRTPETIKKARERLKKAAQHSFAGMSVLQTSVASARLKTWLQAQALGLLGNVPDEITDPNTGQKVQVQKNVSPEYITKQWGAHVGQNDDHGQQIMLGVPAVSKAITYRVQKSDGSLSEPVTKQVTIPILKSGKLLPRLAGEFRLSPQQRQAFAMRNSNFDLGKMCPGSTGLDWSAIEDRCKAAKRAGQVGDLENLLRNFDLLTPEQKQHLVTNQRDLTHFIAAQQGYNKDVWSKKKEHYAVGWDTNKGKRKLAPMDMSEHQAQQVVQKYFTRMFADADRNIQYYINYANRTGVRYEVIQLLENIQTDLAKVAAALLCLNLNDPTLGVRDEELGLKNVPATRNPESNARARKSWAWNFARDLSQAAFGDIPSRRQREKSRGNVSLDAQQGSNAEGGSTSLGANVTADKTIIGQSGEGGGADPSHDTRRTQLDPQTQQDAEGNYPIARMIWNVPKIGAEIDSYFTTYRNIIQEKLGSQYAQMVDDTTEKMKLEVQAIKELYDKAAEEAVARGASPDEVEAAGTQAVQNGLKQKLAELDPTKYGNMSNDEVEKMVNSHRTIMNGIAMTPELKADQLEQMTDFFDELLQNGKSVIPMLSYNDDDKSWGFGEGDWVELDKFKDADASAIVGFIKGVWDEDGAKKYAAPLLKAAAVLRGEQMSDEQAAQAVQQAGLQTDAPATPQAQQSATPAQAVPSIKVGQPAAQAAQAATDVTGALPAGWQQQISNPQWVQANRQVLQQKMEALKARFKQMQASGGDWSEEESDTYHAISKIMRSEMF